MLTKALVAAFVVFSTCLVQSVHVFDEEIEFNVLKRNFVKNLLADARSAKQANKPGARLDFDNRIDDFKSTFNSELQRRKPLGVRRRRSIDEEVKAGIPTLMGFEEIAYIPVAFALDICLFQVDQSLHVATLHWEKDGQNANNATQLTLFQESPPHSFNFSKYYDFKTKNARRMDCVSTADKSGLVVVVNNIDTNHPLTDDAQLEMGSPVFRITETDDGKVQPVELVQFFNRKNQQRVDLWTHGNDIFLIQTIDTFNTTLRPQCPIFKWTGFNFNLMQELPCMNAVEVQKFTIHQEFFMAFANHRNDEGATNIFSFVYRLDPVADRFELHQRLFTNAAKDIRYFYFDNDHIREHFLIVGNMFELDDSGRPNFEAHSMIYKFVNGFFTPFQSIQLNRVRKVLPVMGETGEFVLLVACENDEIKLYQYDGWRFYAASIDYTGAAFEKGVAYMRTYRNINNRTLISIANENMYGEHANLYSPTFRLHDDLEAVHASILKWCDDNYKRLSEQNLEALLATVEKLPKIGKESINLNGKLTLQRGAIKKLETESLITPKGTLDADLAAEINKAHARVQQMQATVWSIESKLEHSILKNGSVTLVGDVHVERFESKVGNVTGLNVTTMNGLLLDARKSRERAVAQNDVLNITVEVEELIVEDGLNVQLLNDVPTANFLYGHDAINLQNLTIHAKAVIFGADLHVAKTIDGVEFTSRHVIFHDMNQTMAGGLRSQNLVVRHLDTLSLNGHPVEETLQSLHELVEKTSYPTVFEEITADNLTLHGSFNGLDILALADITLKNRGDQVLGADYDIETLVTPQLTTTSTISGEELSNLVRSDNGTFVVNQDVLFEAPLEVNDLVVEDRINNINVQNGKLDMLLKRSANVQVISGDKVFERLRLMGSIELQGKIRSESLGKMNPIATLDQDLFLDGDYTINGNVTIKRLLNASDIYGRSKVHSVGRLLKDGLEVNAVVPFPVDFRQHIKVEHLVANRLNDFDPRKFVRASVEENQVITGLKKFSQDLTVKVGLCDVEKVNGVSMRGLNATILKTHGDQEVHGRIHFSKVFAKNTSTLARDAKLAGTKVSDFLNLKAEQILPAKFTINGPVHVKTGLEVLNLNTSGQLFGHTMTTLIEDTVVDSTVKIGGDKYFTSCEFDDLTMVSPTATFCNVNLHSLQDKIGYLGSDLLIQESVHFDSPMRVKHLTFEHTLNGMRKSEFGNTWLLSESEQTFTEPQVFENLLVEDETALDGLCNGRNLTELYKHSYSTLRDEEIVSDLEFIDDVVFQQPVRIDGTLAGINLSEEALLLNASGVQRIEELTVAGNVTVSEGISIDERLNGVDFQKLSVFTGNTPSDAPLVLQVLGNAEFQVQPVIEVINGVNLNDMVKNAWFVDENVVVEAETVMHGAFFDKMLVLKGPLNHLSPDYLINNYVSLSVPQEVSARLKFTGNAGFENVLSADELVVNGTLLGFSYDEGLDITAFDKFVLKKGVPQTITAPWHFKELHYTDNAQTCSINGLNLADDVLRYDQPRPMTGYKYFTRLQANHTNCPVPCYLGDINLSDWIGKAVLNFGNYTIQGTTVLRNPVVYGNILSLGPVNNLTFDGDTLMLKSADQVVTGDMQIKTKFVESNRIWMSLFEKLRVDEINGRPVDVFLNNVARSDETPLTIDTKLHFLEPLAVNQLQCVNCQLFGVNVSSLMTEFEEKLLVGRYEKALSELHGVAQSLANSFESRAYYLHHYELRQSIYGSILKVLPIELIPSVTHLAVFKAEPLLPPTILFYRWDMNSTSWEVDFVVPPLPSNDHLTITKFAKVSLHFKEYLVVETYDKPRRAHIMALHRLTDHSFDIAYQFASNVSASVLALTLADKQCLGLYSEFKADLFVTCLAPDGLTLVQHQVVKTANVRQAVALPGQVLLLTVDQKIVVLSGYPLQPIQVVHTISPSYIAGVFYRQHRYLVVCSEKAENSVHHGLVEIYRSIGGEHFHHFQTIAVKIPIQAEFSVLPTNELMLYVVTNNPTQPIYIYQYAGAAGFKEFIQTSMIPRGQAMQVVQVPELQKEFVALTAKDEVVLIEACMKF